MKEVTLGDLGLEGSAARVLHENFQLPADKPPVKMIDGDPSQQAKMLVQLLREEAKVI